MKQLYLSFVLPYFQYGLENWYSTYSNVTQKAIVLQKRAIRAVYGVPYYEHTNDLFENLQVLKLEDLYRARIIIYMHKAFYSDYDTDLLSKLTRFSDMHTHLTRNRSVIILLDFRKFKSRFSIEYVGPNMWNSLTYLRKDTEDQVNFKNSKI